MTTTTTGTLVMAAYISSATQLIDDEGLLEILKVSRINNSRDAITGMLLYKRGNFIQVLEGPEEKVTETLAKVRRDTRHTGMIVMFKKPIEDRFFGQWSMGFQPATDLSASDEAAFSSFLTPTVSDADFRAKGDRCYRLLVQFKDNMR